MKFRNRIALYYMIATALIMAFTFSIIYLIVWKTVDNHIKEDLQFEARKHLGEVGIVENKIAFINTNEWKEREHREIQVHPVFIQLMDSQGKIIDKSPNLKDGELSFNTSNSNKAVKSKLNDRSIQQLQLPIEIDQQIKGYLLAATNSESYQRVLLNLRNVLLISYFIILVGLYFISRILAGRSIMPIRKITETIGRIRRHHLTERVPLPQKKDELHELSASFNSLLDRIESTLLREKQFTTDASHELRTPLASLRGTLEVLIRKSRSEAEYKEKIEQSLVEIDRMSKLVDQLLQLARLDEQSAASEQNKLPIRLLIEDCLKRNQSEILKMDLKVTVDLEDENQLSLPVLQSSLILDNLIGNAIKYSNHGGKISIDLTEEKKGWRLRIIDQGIGIKAEDQEDIFKSFYRSEPLMHKNIKGSGLGLSIAKKCIQSLNAEIEVNSSPNEGTEFSIWF